MAIFGPQRSTQAEFVIDIGDKVRVPIISPALSAKESDYLIGWAGSSSSQAKAIAAIVKKLGWREVGLISEDSNYGSALVPFLVRINVFVSNQIVVSPSAGNEQILRELYNLRTMETRVYIVHMLPDLASRFFKMAKEAGMMEKGYVWIISDPLTSLLDCVDSDTIKAMQCVIGVKAYIPRSNKLKIFTRRRIIKRVRKENPHMDTTEVNVFGLWAYDSVTALAKAIEQAGVTSPRFNRPIRRGYLTDLEAIGTSEAGTRLASSIRNHMSKGLSGHFSITNGRLQPSAFEIVKVLNRKGGVTVGFWTEKYGISKELNSKKEDNLNIVCPGWDFPASGKKLKVGIPVNSVFPEFIQFETDDKPTGFSIEVFNIVMSSLPYDVPFEYIPFDAGDYGDVVKQIFLERFDAVVGDVTVTAKRSDLADFTFPYTESGVAAIVPIKTDGRKNAWIFLKPLTTGLWLTIGAHFLFTGFVVWVLEHRVIKGFQSSALQQVGMIFWFSFSTHGFAHRERVISNLTRFVVLVWVFVVFVLTSSYTANLASMLAGQQLQPTITGICDLIRNGENVGYQNGSFVFEFLNNMTFGDMKFNRSSSKLVSYSSLEQYDEALSKGSKNGGVAAIVDELPYITLFLSKYRHKYTMIGPIYPTAGLGFAFRKGSSLVRDASREILKLKENEKMVNISNQWLGEKQGYSPNDENLNTAESLNLDSFVGLFLIAGLSSSLALAIFLSSFLYENRHILTSAASIKQKLCDLARVYNQESDDTSPQSKESATRKRRASALRRAISV